MCRCGLGGGEDLKTNALAERSDILFGLGCGLLWCTHSTNIRETQAKLIVNISKLTPIFEN